MLPQQKCLVMGLLSGLGLELFERSSQIDARSVMVAVVEKGHSDPSSYPGRSCLHFTLC